MKDNRKRNNPDSKRYEEWLICAEADIYASELLLTREETLDLATFHCHQAIEKTLKGFLLYHKNIAPDGHSLTYLMRICIKIDRVLNKWFDECIELNSFYVQTRYPSDFPLELDLKKVNELLNTSKKIYNYILKILCDEVFQSEKKKI